MTIRAFMGTCLLATVQACAGATGSDGGTGPSPTPTPIVASIKLNYASASIAKGQTLGIIATPVDVTGAAVAGKTISWTVDNAATVGVDATGTIVGNTPGGATVTASVDGKSATSSVTVIAFTAIQPGMLNTCALAVGGRLMCAGSSYGSLAKPEGGALRFVLLTSHSEPEGSDVAHFCALTADGAAYCWGSNASGELGVGDTNPRGTPTLVVGGRKFQSIVAGQHHTCGLTMSNGVYCWGANDSGQLGNGTTDPSVQPVQILGTPIFSSIESGHFFTCALTSDGIAWCWGRNNLAQLGGGDFNAFRSVPAPVAGAERFKSLASKWTWACGLTQTGSAFCWGDNTLSQLGSVTSATCEGGKPCALKPTAAAAGMTFTAIATSQFSTCATSAGNQLWCWGGDMQNQFGAAAPPSGCGVVGFAFGCTASPVQGPSGFSTVKASPRSYCGIALTNGVAYCWGGNGNKQLGNPNAGSQTGTPVVFSIDPTSGF